MPPMQKHQQLDFATATMKRPKPVPYKRFKLSSPEKSFNESKDTIEEIGIEPAGDEAEIVESEGTEKKTTKLISVGSPIPDSYIKSKPPLENWSENNTLAELIYFENLPNYTGVFDKMTSVLRSVRNRLFNKSPPSSTADPVDDANNNDESQQVPDSSQQTTSTDDSDILILN